MVKRRDKKKSTILFIVSIFFLLIGTSLGILSEYYFNFLDKEENIIVTEFNQEILFGENIGYINVPAIDQNGNGIPTRLIVKVEEGNGKTLVDIDSLLYWIDTQNSIRMAKIVAENYTGVNLDNYDLTFSVDANASLIGGESAGAALTLATVAAIQGKKFKDDIMITGTINHDGTIGPVGGILQKAKAAKDIGSSLFLVPLLQSKEITYESHEHCETFGVMEWCTVEQIPKQIEISNEIEIEVIEVGSIRDAISYFIEEQTI